MDYTQLCAQLQGLIGGVPHLTANLANAAALLWQTLEDINWVGFYLVEGQTLVLGPFQGKPACIEIGWGRGVCGTAAERDEAQLVGDVHAFPGHIAGDSASRSEAVIPLHDGGRVTAVLDVDSPLPGRFTDGDLQGLQAVAAVLERELAGLW